jgi:hypothetical protein
MDKTNLMRKIAELDDMVKTLVGTQNSQHVPQSSKTKVYLHFLFLVGFSYIILQCNFPSQLWAFHFVDYRTRELKIWVTSDLPRGCHNLNDFLLVLMKSLLNTANLLAIICMAKQPNQ